MSSFVELTGGSACLPSENWTLSGEEEGTISVNI